MDSNVESLPEVRAITGEISQLEQYVSGYKVATAEQYQAGADDLKRVKAAQKRLEDTRTSITGPMNAALKRVNDFFRTPSDKLTLIERTIKGALTRYADEQERIRQEEQRRAEAAAAAERARLARLQAEAEAKARAEQERLRREAAAAEAAGRAAEAAKLAAKADRVEEKAAAKVEELQVREAMVVAPVVMREAPKVSGVSTREVWRHEIVDAAKIPREYLIVDETKIRKVVQALKGDANIPGVRVYSERQLAAGAA